MRALTATVIVIAGCTSPPAEPDEPQDLDAILELAPAIDLAPPEPDLSVRIDDLRAAPGRASGAHPEWSIQLGFTTTPLAVLPDAGYLGTEARCREGARLRRETRAAVISRDPIGQGRARLHRFFERGAAATVPAHCWFAIELIRHRGDTRPQTLATLCVGGDCADLAPPPATGGPPVAIADLELRRAPEPSFFFEVTARHDVTDRRIRTSATCRFSDGAERSDEHQTPLANIPPGYTDARSIKLFRAVDPAAAAPVECDVRLELFRSDGTREVEIGRWSLS